MAQKILKLERTVEYTKRALENSVIDRENAYKTINVLENKLKNSPILEIKEEKDEQRTLQLETLYSEIIVIKKENGSLEKRIEDQANLIKDEEANIETQRNISRKFKIWSLLLNKVNSIYCKRGMQNLQHNLM